MSSNLFNVKDQLIFYGQYHSNRVNVAIHMIFVPTILWTGLIILAGIPVPSFFPTETYQFSQYLSFQWSWAVPLASIYALYYFILEPFAALLYTPLLSTMLLSASPIAAAPWGPKMAAWLFSLAWAAQFAGHGFAEKRSPALLDNIVGALVLAPFFVHLEILFALGYRPKLHKEITNGVGVAIAKFRKQKADARRAKEL